MQRRLWRTGALVLLCAGMRRMRKFILVFFLALLLIGTGVFVYLNAVVLPGKVRVLVLRALSETTGKDVSIGSLRISLFKGLLIRDILIEDEDAQFLKLREVRCSVLLLPFFKKQLVVPRLRLKGAEFFIERRLDGSWNLDKLRLPRAAEAPGGVRLFISRVTLTDSTVRFRDAAVADPAFVKTVENLNASAAFSLSSTVAFSFKAELPGPLRSKLSGTGTYQILRQTAQAKLSASTVSPRDFQPYYRASGIKNESGTLNVRAMLSSDKKGITARLEYETSDMVFSREKVSCAVACSGTTELGWDFKAKSLSPRTVLFVRRVDLFGVPLLERLTASQGTVRFQGQQAQVQDARVVLWDIPCSVSGTYRFAPEPSYALRLETGTDLQTLTRLLAEKFSLVIPARISGDATLAVAVRGRPGDPQPPSYEGELVSSGATVVFAGLDKPLEAVAGTLRFDTGGLSWEGLRARFAAVDYTLTGTLENFLAPSVKCTVDSAPLSAQTHCTVLPDSIAVSKCAGRWYNSRFSAKGLVMRNAAPRLPVRAQVNAEVALQDLARMFPARKDLWEKMQPAATVRAKFSLDGDVRAPVSCAVEGRLSAPELTAWGLRGSDVFCIVSLRDSLAELQHSSACLYGGELQVQGKMNLSSANLPYWATVQAQGVRLQDWQKETAAAKTKDLAGTVDLFMKLNGFSHNLDKLSGAGTLSVRNGRFWQLNLFKGLGSVIFIKDFERIVFTKGECAFLIKDRFLSSDDVKMFSAIAEVNGPVRIGFDRSLEARLNVNVLDEMVPLSGTFRDVTTAIVGQGGRFGVITVGGSLDEPKFKFKTAVGDILKGLKNVFFNKSQ